MGLGAKGTPLEIARYSVEVSVGGGMVEPVTLTERAYELARSGEYGSVNALRQRLRREGYATIHADLHGATINIELIAIIRGCTLRSASIVHQR